MRNKDDPPSGNPTLFDKLKLRVAELLGLDDRMVKAWLLVLLGEGLSILEQAVADHVANGNQHPMTEEEWEVIFQSIADPQQRKLASLVYRLLKTLMDTV